MNTAVAPALSDWAIRQRDLRLAGFTLIRTRPLRHQCLDCGEHRMGVRVYKKGDERQVYVICGHCQGFTRIS